MLSRPNIEQVTATHPTLFVHRLQTGSTQGWILVDIAGLWGYVGRVLDRVLLSYAEMEGVYQPQHIDEIRAQLATTLRGVREVGFVTPLVAIALRQQQTPASTC